LNLHVDLEPTLKAGPFAEGMDSVMIESGLGCRFGLCACTSTPLVVHCFKEQGKMFAVATGQVFAAQTGQTYIGCSRADVCCSACSVSIRATLDSHLSTRCLSRLLLLGILPLRTLCLRWVFALRGLLGRRTLGRNLLGRGVWDGRCAFCT